MGQCDGLVVGELEQVSAGGTTLLHTALVIDGAHECPVVLDGSGAGGEAGGEVEEVGVGGASRVGSGDYVVSPYKIEG